MKVGRLTLTPEQYKQSLPHELWDCSVCKANYAEACDLDELLVVPVINDKTQWRAAMPANRAHKKRKGDERDG